MKHHYGHVLSIIWTDNKDKPIPRASGKLTRDYGGRVRLIMKDRIAEEL